MIDIRIGDGRKLVKTLGNDSVDCVMTSPPYWGLRDYGHEDQIGLEETTEAYIEGMINLFSDIKDKLKPSGNCFVNLGDTYNKHKSLCMIPERFAFGMIEAGWILRNKIIWYKPNHMPESVRDRLTKSYEVIYHFVKSKKYYYDLDAIREPYKTQENRPSGMIRSQDYNGKYKGSAINPELSSSPRARTQRDGYQTNGNNPLGKNPGDVWHINTKPYTKAHFATYPLELIRKPILAGCPVGGVVLDPFGGSGTTAEFCKNNGRNCITFELNPEYESLINERADIKSSRLTDYI